MHEQLHIAVGILADDHGRVLLSERRAGTHGAGEWEFPGGKVEPGEALADALARELHEELGVAVKEARPLIRVRHRYAERSVVLDTWRVTAWRGDLQALEGQRLAWVAVDRLHQWPLMAADGPIVTALRLPSTYLFTGSFGDTRDALSRLRASLSDGVRLVRLRAPGADEQAYAVLAREAVAVCHAFGARCLLDRSPSLVRELGADGLHLTAAALATPAQRPLPREYWVGASCHDAAELARAAELGADFAVLSPVRPTPSHPKAEPLGWAGFRALVETVNMPVNALGGLGRDELSAAWAAGAQGVAAIRGLWPPK